MSGVLLWGYDATNKKYIPLAVDANGYVKVDMSNINLDDLADTYLPTPGDQYFLYYDNASGKWTCRILVDADIPAGIARDAEVVAAVAAEATARAAAIAAIELDDLNDLSVAAPTDGYVLYWDNANSLWKCKKVEGSNLSQTFGASAARLRNMIVEPIAGSVLRILHCSGTAFSGLIDDTPAAHGGQGLDATHVPYDGDSEEDMFKNMTSYDGSLYWGQFILHNIARGNSRKIVSVDRTNNVIVTTSSTDDWADDDVIDTESQTVESGAAVLEFVDVDVSDFVGTGVNTLILFVAFRNNTANANAANAIFFHPYETYNAGKRQWVAAAAANDSDNGILLVNVIDQKITLCVENDGEDDFAIVISVIGIVEFADT